MVTRFGRGTEAHLIHNSTGEKLIIKRSTSSFISGLHYSSSSNKLGINLHGQNVLLGGYSIELLLDDNSVLKLPQPVTVIPGIAYLNYEEQIYYGYRVVAGENLTIDGYNLFEKTTLPEHFFKPLIISELDINPSDKGSYTVTP